MKLSIVSLNYKTKEKTSQYIENIFNIYKEELKKNIVELIIVDNASNDGSAEYIKNEIKKNHYINISLITNKENEGFGKGCNLGASHAKSPYVIFLNNDTQVNDKGFLDMVSFMERHPEVAVMGGKMKNPNGTKQLSAWKFYTLENVLPMMLGFERFGILKTSPSTVTRVDWVTGGCMMVNKKFFDQLGGFDKQIFMYMEDMELCYRAKQHGYATYYYPDLDIIHTGQGSSNRSFAIVNIYKGILYFYKKHMPFWQYEIIKAVLKAKAFILIYFGKLINNNYFVHTYEKALTVF